MVEKVKGFAVADLFVPEIQELVQSRDFKAIKEICKSMSLVDLADVWEKFSKTEQVVIFRLLTGREASSLFQELEPEDQEHLLNNLGNKELEGLLDDFDPEEAARVFQELPKKTVRFLKTHLESDTRRSVEEILKYPDDTVGSWMRIQTVVLTPQHTTSQALERIRKCYRLRKGGGPDGYYVTDKAGKAIGWVTLRKLIVAPPRMKLREYMSPVKFLRLDPNAPQEEAAHLFSSYKLSMAPVLDKNGKYLGYIQAEDILPLMEEEVTEDILKMAGTNYAEFESDSVWASSKVRFPWLIATCAGQLMVALVIHHFNFVLAKFIALASFLPFIAAMGGNVGSQSSTFLVRALALREYDFNDRWKLLVKETSIGLFLGVVYGIIIGGLAFAVYGTQFGDMFPFVIGLATVAAMTVATMTGVIGPFTLVKFKVDPATATGPLITTITDIIGTAIYFLLAVWMLL